MCNLICVLIILCVAVCTVYQYSQPQEQNTDEQRQTQILTQLNGAISEIRAEFRVDSPLLYPASAIISLPRMIFSNIIGLVSYVSAGGDLGPCSTCHVVDTMMCQWDLAISTYTQAYSDYIMLQQQIGFITVENEVSLILSAY